MDSQAPAKTALSSLSRGLWALGFVSLLMDVSSEMIHSLLPLFMVGTLGASALAVGLVEGVAESTALIVKIFRCTQRLLAQAQGADHLWLRIGGAN